MTWNELVREAAVLAKSPRSRSLPASQVKRVLVAAFVTIAEDVLHGGRVAIPSFGVFYQQRRAARRIRNPVTRELMTVPQTTGVGFRCSRTIKR